MEFEQLKQFLTLVETEHFARAAKKCGLSPSAFTRSIKRLEDNFGFDLFERDNRSVRLTYGGESLQGIRPGYSGQNGRV